MQTYNEADYPYLIHPDHVVASASGKGDTVFCYENNF
jgi:hypothetical protein